MIELIGVTKRFGDRLAVSSLDLTVSKGELLVLLGGSGCGKTTTLKMINRLIEPTSGSIRINGRDNRALPAPALRRQIGYCFQRIGLFPHMTVAQNIEITPKLLGWPQEQRHQRVNELLDLVQLSPDDYRTRLPSTLSGGQQQRVGVARALAARPEVVLFDEPFGALDPITRDHLQTWVKTLSHDLGLTAIFVTHDITEALLLGDRIAVMHEGQLLQVGRAADLLAEPASPYVAELLETPARQAQAVRDALGAT